MCHCLQWMHWLEGSCTLWHRLYRHIEPVLYTDHTHTHKTSHILLTLIGVWLHQKLSADSYKAVRHNYYQVPKNKILCLQKTWKGHNLHGQNCVPNAVTWTKFTSTLCALSTMKWYKGQLYMIHNLCIYQLYFVTPISTSLLTLYSCRTTIVHNDTKYSFPFMML